MHSYLNISVAQLHDESGSGSMTQHFVATANPACEVAHYAQQQQCTRGCGSPRPGGGDTHRVRSYACPYDTRRGRRGSKTRAPPFLFCSQSLPRTGDAVAGLNTATQPLLKASGRKPARASKTLPGFLSFSVRNQTPLVRPVTQRPGPDLRTTTILVVSAVRNPFALRFIPVHAQPPPHPPGVANPGGNAGARGQGSKRQE